MRILPWFPDQYFPIHQDNILFIPQSYLSLTAGNRFSRMPLFHYMILYVPQGFVRFNAQVNGFSNTALLVFCFETSLPCPWFVIVIKLMNSKECQYFLECKVYLTKSSHFCKDRFYKWRKVHATSAYTIST